MLKGTIKVYTKKEILYYDLREKNIENILSKKNIIKLEPAENLTLVFGSEELVLYPIENEQLNTLRAQKAKLFILKIDNYIFATILDKELKVSNLFGDFHLCAQTCKRLSALPDPQGCLKVRDIKKKIESYPFIRLGYQIDNTKNNDCLIIGICDNFVLESRKPLPYSVVKARKDNLIEYAQNPEKIKNSKIERYKNIV